VSFIDEMFDESELLSDDDKAALAAEERGETYEEPEPEPPPEIVERTRELESELAAERERVWRLDERRRAAEEIEAATGQQRLAEQTAEPPTQLGPKPDAYLDPFGADIWEARRETELVRIRLEEQQRAAEQREFSNWVDSDAARFRAEHADYDAAAAHAYNFRVEYWKRLGLPEAHSCAIVDQEAAATGMLARQNGRSAAATFYELGQKVGHQPKRTQQSSGPIRQRQSAPVRGKPQGRRRVTAEDIDALPEAELEATIRRNPHTVVRALEKLGW
jgi:hypothetical protein